MKDTGLGANVDFDYLDDDDDDATSGGVGAESFDATVVVASSGPANTELDFDIAIDVGVGAQTNASFTVTIQESNGAAVTGITTNPGAWSQTGWSYNSVDDLWTNTFTNASVSVGSSSIDLGVTSTPGNIEISTMSVAPDTDQATGSGSSTYIEITSAFDMVPNAPPTTTPSGGFTFDFTVDVTCAPLNQTNGSCTVYVYSNSSITPTTLNLNGWGESGWGTLPPNLSFAVVYWNTLTRTTVSDANAPSFRVTGSGSSPIEIDTSASIPSTDQSTGAGGADTVTVV